MKLIVTGATGFVATEVIRQSFRHPGITSVIAVARKPVPVPSNLPPGSDTSKLRSVVVNDYSEYPEDLKKEFAGAGACIWTVAITISKSTSYDFNDVIKVCQLSTMAGLKAMYEADPARPFRFLYVSGIAAERDQTKTPGYKPQYSLMRGETENQVLAFAAESKGKVEASAAKPGLIKGPGRILQNTAAVAAGMLFSVPTLEVKQIAAAMLDQAVKGFEKDALMHDDLVRIGNAAIKENNVV